VGGNLWIADYGNQRFLKYTGVPTSNGASATFVLGQENFRNNSSLSEGTNDKTINRPIFVEIIIAKANMHVEAYQNMYAEDMVIKNAIIPIIISGIFFAALKSLSFTKYKKNIERGAVEIIIQNIRIRIIPGLRLGEGLDISSVIISTNVGRLPAQDESII
jgi:hypothetical protein